MSSLLKVENLSKSFPLQRGLLKRTLAFVRAVDGVSFEIKEGETLGLVGESGCGKSTLGRLILRLIEPTDGRIIFMGKEVLELSPRAQQILRRDIQIVFQDPFDSLNPKMKVGDIIAEPLIVNRLVGKFEIAKRVGQLLDAVGLQPEQANRYPHQFSGGQRQRVGIARALALNPKLVILDEPVSSLDLSIGAQILNLLMELQERFGLSYLLIAHNLSVIEHMSDRVMVMYMGKIVEVAKSSDLYREPLHPYTQALLSAAPSFDRGENEKRVFLEGELPSLLAPPTGCKFHTRCPYLEEKCERLEPKLDERRKDHWVACHLVPRFARD